MRLRQLGSALGAATLVCATAVVARTTASDDAQGSATYAADVAPIVLAHCATCHRPGQAAPFPLLSYDDVRAQGQAIVLAITSRHMPPWHATQGRGFPELRDDNRLTNKQIDAIVRWFQHGMPTGDLKRAPVPGTFPVTWPLGVPDLAISLPRVVATPASDAHAYRNVVVEVGVPADVWLSAIDYQPGDSGVLRHVRFYAAPPDLVVRDDDVLPGVGGLLGSGSLENYGDQLLAAGRSLVDLGSWVPGVARRSVPEPYAIKLPARWSVVMQMHFKPTPVDAIENGTIALYFAKPVARQAIRPLDLPPALGIAAGLAIPAGDSRHVLRDSFTLPVAVEAIGARGHANYLGREVTITATLPNGSKTGLLKITNWDVDWPDTYYFVKPIRLPKGTAVQTEIVYDNSKDNRRNIFLPPRRVGWGRLSSGEMGSGTLLIASAAGADAEALDAALATHLKDQLLGRKR